IICMQKSRWGNFNRGAPPARQQDSRSGGGEEGGGSSGPADGGGTRNRIRQPIPSECNVRALTVYPDDPHRILAGTDVGLYRSEDAGATWENLDAPTEGIQIWSVAVDAANPDTLFVGTRPDAFRSRNGGKTWEPLS